MKRMVARLKKYMDTYDSQSGYLNYSDKTFIEDVIYGLALAMGPKKFQFAQGQRKFKKFLAQYLKDNPS